MSICIEQALKVRIFLYELRVQMLMPARRKHDPDYANELAGQVEFLREEVDRLRALIQTTMQPKIS